VSLAIITIHQGRNKGCRYYWEERIIELALQLLHYSSSSVKAALQT